MRVNIYGEELRDINDEHGRRVYAHTQAGC
jgi:hypothetical protein